MAPHSAIAATRGTHGSIFRCPLATALTGTVERRPYRRLRSEPSYSLDRMTPIPLCSTHFLESWWSGAQTTLATTSVTPVRRHGDGRACLRRSKRIQKGASRQTRRLPAAVGPIKQETVDKLGDGAGVPVLGPTHRLLASGAYYIIYCRPRSAPAVTFSFAAGMRGVITDTDYHQTPQLRPSTRELGFGDEVKPAYHHHPSPRWRLRSDARYAIFPRIYARYQKASGGGLQTGRATCSVTPTSPSTAFSSAKAGRRWPCHDMTSPLACGVPAISSKLT